ncbi:MAG: hypothetical protein SGBAC_006541 [Bacillariaceae sp.]
MQHEKSSPRVSLTALVTSSRISLPDKRLSKSPTDSKSSTDHTKKEVDTKQEVDEKADYSIFHQPKADAFEPIPFGKPRTRQQQAALSGMVEETIRFLFHTDDAPDMCKSKMFDKSLLDLDSENDSSDTEEPRPKRQCLSTDEYSTLRFRTYQTDAWDNRLEALLKFRALEGHCSIPHSYPEDPALARWVKRQRYQYKLRTEGKTSTMTAHRVKVLEEIGFVWDSHLAAWEERLSDLRKYKTEHGNCEVPTHYQANKKLATWVKCQRRQYKLYVAGMTSTMNAQRVDILNRLGFSWDMRSSKKDKSSVL